MKVINCTIAVLILITNIFFLRLTFLIFQENGGYMGYGIYILIASLPINLLLIPATLVLFKKFRGSLFLLILNWIGLLWIIFWFVISEYNNLNWFRLV